MKKVRRVLCALLVPTALFASAEYMYLPRYLRAVDPATPGTHSEIRIMSANVRCWSPTDLGRRSWFYRAPLVLQNIADEQPDILGLQEVTRLHYAYLTKNLPDYESVLTYRDSSPLSESCPIFFNTQRFTCTDAGSFWLSETPEKSSKDWGSACPRICTYVILREKTTDKQLVVFNTHLDHVSDEARIRGIGVVLDKLQQFGDLPCVLMGDLNAREDTETYRAATQSFDDAKYRTADPPAGPTYQKWGHRLNDENIDYFLISKTGISVSDYRIADTVYDGVYPSDHFPILLHIDLS